MDIVLQYFLTNRSNLSAAPAETVDSLRRLWEVKTTDHIPGRTLSSLEHRTLLCEGGCWGFTFH